MVVCTVSLDNRLGPRARLSTASARRGLGGRFLAGRTIGTAAIAGLSAATRHGRVILAGDGLPFGNGIARAGAVGLFL